MKSKDELRKSFENGDIPKQEEFWEWQDSYWHKDEKLSPDKIDYDFSKKADLVDGKIPASQLPSYVDDVLEFDSLVNLPSQGEKGKIYLLTNNNNQYRWSGSEYILINSKDYINQFIPYTGAVNNVNLNKKNITNAGSIEATSIKNGITSVIVKSLSLHNTTTVTSFGVKLTHPSSSIMMGSFTVTLFGYTGQTLSFRVTMYKYDHNWHRPSINWLHGDSSKISNIEFYKEDDSNLHIKVNFVTNFGAYHKSVITDVLAHENDVLHNPDIYTLSINPDNSPHTLVQTTSNTGFIRDNVGDAPKTSISLGTVDLNTITTPGFYHQLADANATTARNYPITNSGYLIVYRTTGGGVVQEYTSYLIRGSYKRYWSGANWANWVQLIDSANGGVISADLTVSKNPEGNINIGTGGSAGSIATPKTMNLNFIGYSNALKAKISSADIGANSVLSPLIFHTYAQTGLQESMRIEGNGNIKATALSGTGTRMVIADSTGTLSTQAIPNVVNYLPLTGTDDFTGSITNPDGTVSFGKNGSYNASLYLFDYDNTDFPNLYASISLNIEEGFYVTKGNISGTENASLNVGYNTITFQAQEGGEITDLQIDAGGLTGNYKNPTLDGSYIQKKYINDNYIPLTGTLTGKEVSGWIEFDNNYNNGLRKKAGVDAAIATQITMWDDEGVRIHAETTENRLDFIVSTGFFVFNNHNLTNSTFSSIYIDNTGIYGNQYIVPTTDDHYVQKKYVTDNFASHSQLNNYIPLTGTQNFTGALVSPSYDIMFGNDSYYKAKIYLHDRDNANFPGSRFEVSGNIEEGFFVYSKGSNNSESSLGNTTQGFSAQSTMGSEMSELLHDSTGLFNITYKTPLTDNYYIQRKYATDNFISVLHAVNNITSTQIANWHSAYNFTNNFAANNPDLVAIEALAGTDGYLRKGGNGAWSLVSSPVVDASSTTAGKVKLFSDTVQSVAANGVTTTASRTYGVQVNSSGQMVVNVPWVDTNTAYTLPAATTTALGGVRLFSATVNTSTPNTPTATAGRTYAVQFNASNQMVVNVPWVDSNTTYTNGTGLNLSGTTFSVNYGTAAGTAAQGNDIRINNGQTAFGWGNHAAAGYATAANVEDTVNEISVEITDPDYEISVKNKLVTIIITEDFKSEKIDWKEFYPGQSICVINTSGKIVNLDLQGKTFDKISEKETSEYYINSKLRIVKKGTYKSAEFLN